MKQIFSVAALASVLVLASCATPGFGPNGGLFTSTTVGVSADGQGSKTGEACASSILGIAAMGDASVKAAAASAGISKVKSVDLKSFSILGLYANLCTVVTGD